RAASRRYKLVNNYGPTESTVVATSTVQGLAEEILTIGRPIANTRIYIVGAEGQLQPVGVAGELCIAGRGLARGYNNRPEETREKFAMDPFVPGERMYKTGDLARWLEDGSIEYLGRKDLQVKVRGFRIELSEIEAQLAAHPGVQAAVVAGVPDAHGNTALCAYVVPEGLTAAHGR
ncbi:AMP-binding protein, partial [Paenibacillus macerans]|uniref:AMP-binding protein n=1 Tax=Paenibacillus macerans TaxID=44252 RepID=UPI003D322532